MQLSKAEEQLMEFIWKEEKTFLKNIIDHYPEPKPAATTIATLLKRMQKKGVLPASNPSNDVKLPSIEEIDLWKHQSRKSYENR